MALYEQALAVHQQAFGYDHPKTRATREHYITLLHALKRYEKAALLEAAHSEQEEREARLKE
jgi:hypothetical protein